MILFPPAKINLGLNVLRKRPDGFHDIETVFYPIPLKDALEIVPSAGPKNTFKAYGLDIPGDPAENLCLKGVELIQDEFQTPPVDIFLYKAIPTGAGLGGGSSDAAATLTIMNDLFALHLSEIELKTYAAKLGSDCAFFIRPAPTFATGRGEVLYEIRLDLSSYSLLLVLPGIHVPTAAAYRAVTPKVPEWRLDQLTDLPMEDWKNIVVNDFEESVFKQFPVLAEIKQKLYDGGAIYASMSGSGSSIYGIFPKGAVPDFSLSGPRVVSLDLE